MMEPIQVFCHRQRFVGRESLIIAHFSVFKLTKGSVIIQFDENVIDEAILCYSVTCALTSANKKGSSLIID